MQRDGKVAGLSMQRNNEHKTVRFPSMQRTRPYITERLLMGCKESNQTKLQRGKVAGLSMQRNNDYKEVRFPSM